MEAANLHKNPGPAAPTGPGELVLQNGRHAGVRRPLGTPTTFIGRTEDSDIRLNVDGVDPMHCLLALGADGVRVRDLKSVHGTYVNGIRVDNVLLRHGDMLKVGPFQFRVELILASTAAGEKDDSLEQHRAAVRIQAAAIAAQQAALEEEETRLAQRRSDLQQQEEQLAERLAEKQRQVQLWSEYNTAEREALRKEKIDQEKLLAKLEQELLQAKQVLAKDHQKLTQERQRINNVYQRLRQRWHRQWSAEREKYRLHALKLQEDASTLHERQKALLVREASLKQDILHFNTQRELGARQLQEGRDALKGAQERWRRRRSHEFLALKGMQRRNDEAQIKLKQARRVLIEEKLAWDQQFDSLQKELHGLNNRIVHQRARTQEQAEDIARLDALLRDRRLLVGQSPNVAADMASIGDAVTPPACEVAIVAENAGPGQETAPTPAPADSGERRFDGLDHMASELADQRVHLIEQFRRLAEIQDAWQRQHDLAAAELETLAHRLLAEEQSLDRREKQAVAVEAMLQQRQKEIDAVRHEIQVCRAQWKTRAQIFERDHHEQTLALRQKEALLQEQLAALEHLRNRWNQHSQQEVDQLRSKLATLENQQTETHTRRVALFEKNQQIEEEKRILAEKALALEQYRQEIFFRAKDPAAQRRVERLRRRWLTLNSALIRTAKAEREATRKDLLQLETQRAELMQSTSQLSQDECAFAQKHALLEEREAMLKARQLQIEEELGKLQRQDSQEKSLRLQNEIDTLAKAVYEEEDAPAVDKAA